MSSSIFEVKESESDSEKVLDFGLDSCEENGIVSTQVDGELPKDHTYTKEPDVLQGDVMNDSDNSTSQPEEMGGISSSPVKPKSSRPTRNAKNAEKAKPKKAPVSKKAAAKKAKAKKDDISEEVDAISESAGNGQIADEPSEESPAEEEAKPAAKRGRKRKTEEKETTEEESASETTNTKQPKESTPKKKAKKAAFKPPSTKKGKVKPEPNDAVIDTENLPPGWIRKSVTRRSGKTAGQIDVYIFSPEGIKFRSKPDVASYLTRTKSSLKIDDFDFSKKRIPVKSTSPEPSKKASKKKTVVEKPKSPVQKKAKAVAAPKKSAKAASPKKSPKPVTPKKTPKLLVKIVSSKPKKSRATKESPAEETKSTVQGKALRGNKKKTNA